MKIGIVSDHRGYILKKELVTKLKVDYEVIDYGTNSEESVDYPDYAFLLGEKINKEEINFGVAICGSGIGISIACNKVKNVRCAKVDTVDEAFYTRNDNDSNVVALSAKLDVDLALAIIKKFVDTEFSNDERHLRRINKIKNYEDK